MIPTTIQDGLVSGIVGTRSHYGPLRGRTGVLASDDESNNVFGRAFTFVDEELETFQAGGGGYFAGILIHPHAYAIDGPTVRNGTPVELVDMDEVYVELEGAAGATFGDPVYYVPATGELTLTELDNVLVPNARVERHLPSPQTPNLAIIRLTN